MPSSHDHHLYDGSQCSTGLASKKEVINNSIAEKKAVIESLEARLAALTTGRAASEDAVAKLYAFRNLDKLCRDSVDFLVDRILIHGEKDIEIVWNDRVG